MNRTGLKAALLEVGTARVTGMPVDLSDGSHAGPGAGGTGSVFFSFDGILVRLSIDNGSKVTIEHIGDGNAVLHFGDIIQEGVIEPVALHCPRQAYITISEGCIFKCRYCNVPFQEQKIKTPEEVVSMIEEVADDIDCISLTSGVIGSPEEDEERVLEIIRKVKKFSLPVGVSTYPLPGTPGRLHDLGVAEVKFNLEAATPELFSEMCPGQDRNRILAALKESVELFGKNHVFSNIILGLGETDDEMKTCIKELCEAGIIPVIRPLNPKAELSDFPRPSAERIMNIFEYHKARLKENGLDPAKAMTMCVACTGCDLTPGRDE
ncbi:radical SAM protein [Methanolacinia paynteri]|uniref:radical SAM protein n=1 Tax=Methanolacinia paynteri TaxID=230356 RepID=UPI00064E9252|nr:radical SAM protein [Methanolacinia paynteri]